MSDQEPNFFAFAESQMLPAATPDGGVPAGPMLPPEAVADLVAAGAAPELPPLRPYNEDFDAFIATAFGVEPGAIPMGEARPKAHSDGTVRVYKGVSKDGSPCTVIVADRDDASFSKHGARFDGVSFPDSTLARLGEGNYTEGLGRVARLAAKSTVDPHKKDAHHGHLSSVQVRVMLGLAIDSLPPAEA